MSKIFTYIGAKNLRLDPETNEHVEIVPHFRGYDFPKGEAVEVTDPVAIAKLSANPDFKEVEGAKGGKGSKGKSGKADDKPDGKGADADKPADQSGAGDAPAA